MYVKNINLIVKGATQIIAIYVLAHSRLCSHGMEDIIRFSFNLFDNVITATTSKYIFYDQIFDNKNLFKSFIKVISNSA